MPAASGGGMTGDTPLAAPTVGSRPVVVVGGAMIGDWWRCSAGRGVTVRPGDGGGWTRERENSCTYVFHGRTMLVQLLGKARKHKTKKIVDDNKMQTEREN